MGHDHSEIAHGLSNEVFNYLFELRYRGHYSDAVLSSLESQNDAEVEGISAKVKMLKDVRDPRLIPPDPTKETGRLISQPTDIKPSRSHLQLVMKLGTPRT